MYSEDYMKITVMDVDYVVVNEENIKNKDLINRDKIHLIKLDFSKPTKEAIEMAVELFPNTNRYVIASNSVVKLYNDTFKMLGKKFYVENSKIYKLVSFLRKNNKILLNVCNLTPQEKQFVLHPSVLPDLLWNCEVMQINKVDYEKVSDIFTQWNGNLIFV